MARAGSNLVAGHVQGYIGRIPALPSPDPLASTMSLMPTADEKDRILASLAKFYKTCGITPAGVMAVTVQRDFKTDFTSLIVDWDNSTVLPSLAAEAEYSYEETRVKNSLSLSQPGLRARRLHRAVCLQVLLLVTRPFAASLSSSSRSARWNTSRPSQACWRIVDIIHVWFLRSRHSLIRGRCSTRNTSSSRKATSKRFPCVLSQDPQPQKSQMVDLYHKVSGSSRHHMRIEPFTRVNADVLDSFFTLLDNEHSKKRLSALLNTVIGHAGRKTGTGKSGKRDALRRNTGHKGGRSTLIPSLAYFSRGRAQ